uniref:Cysteine-rich secretory protein n=1 Tax=Centruroides hentzi TaxID=88313 RepID=A0A2I9LNW0_9SCOR
MWIYLLIWTSLIYNLNSEHHKKFSYFILFGSTCRLESYERFDHEAFYPEEKIVTKALLNVHNCLRNIIRFINQAFPRGTNLLKMEWDDELYRMAKEQIYECDEKSDCSKYQYTEDKHVEQNFKAVVYNKSYEVKDPVLRFAKIIRDWAYEIQNLSGSIVQNFQPDKSPEKDWVNLFRATMYKVGCDSRNFQLNNETFKEIYICNYAPANLKKGEEIYKKGQWCTECPAEMKCHQKWFRLCAPKDDIDDEPNEILWNCDFSEGMMEQCKYEIQCNKDWQTVCRYGFCHQEITTNNPKSSLLFLTPILVKDHACLIFDYKKTHLPINQRESTLTAIAVWNNGKNYTSLEIDEDVNVWMRYKLKIHVKNQKIQVGFVVRKVGNSEGQIISIGNLFVSSGSC